MERATTSTLSGSDRRRRRRTPRTEARRAAVGRSGRTGCLRREERPPLQSADGSHAYGLGLPLLVSTLDSLGRHAARVASVRQRICSKSPGVNRLSETGVPGVLTGDHDAVNDQAGPLPSPKYLGAALAIAGTASGVPREINTHGARGVE